MRQKNNQALPPKEERGFTIRELMFPVVLFSYSVNSRPVIMAFASSKDRETNEYIMIKKFKTYHTIEVNGSLVQTVRNLSEEVATYLQEAGLSDAFVEAHECCRSHFDEYRKGQWHALS